MSGGTFGTNWLDLSSTSNRYTRTYIQGFMDISGGNLIVRNNNLYLTQGDASINGNLILGYDASINRRLFVGSDASFGGNLFVNGDVSMNGQLSVAKASGFSSTLWVGDNAEFNAKVIVSNDVVVNNRLLLTGDASLNNRLIVDGDVSLNRRLYLLGDASFGGKIFVNGDVSMNKRLFLGGGLDMKPTATTSTYTASYLNDNPLFLRGDTNHGLAYGNKYSSIFNSGLDGPFLFGYSGGALGSYNTATTNTALSWSNDKSVTLNGNTNIKGSNILNFGSDQTKETNAGKMGYGTFSSSLDIVGAGTSNGSRSVKIYDTLTVVSTITAGSTISGTKITCSTGGQCGTFYNTSDSATGDVVSISKNNSNTNYCMFWDNNGGSSNGNFVYIENSGQQVGTIRSSNTSSVSYNTSSDYRLKQNITDITNVEYIIENLKPVSFEFKSEPGNKVCGFIAHEVQEFIPICVSGDKDAVNANGKPDYQGIDTGFMIPYIVKMLQIQNQRISDLQQEVSDLKQLLNNK